MFDNVVAIEPEDVEAYFRTAKVVISLGDDIIAIGENSDRMNSCSCWWMKHQFPDAGWAIRNLHGPHMVRTTRNSAFPLIMRAYPSAAFAIGYFSIVGRTPVISANRKVSCESVGMPPAQPLMPFLPKSS